MRKRILILSAVAVLVLAALAVFLFLQSRDTVSLSALPENAAKNGNNYSEYNTVDYRDGKFAWVHSGLGSGLKIYDAKTGKTESVDINCSSFQLCDGGVVYRKRGSLIRYDLQTGERVTVSENADLFLVCDDLIYFRTPPWYDSKAGEWNSRIFRYDIDSGEKLFLYEGNIWAFFPRNETVTVVDGDDHIYELAADGTVLRQIPFRIMQYPFFCMMQGNSLLYEGSNRFKWFDPDTGAEKCAEIVPEEYVNNRINYICNDRWIFYSFQATETNGSLVKNIDSEDNGLWSLDPETLEKVKISDDVFDALYLYGETSLFGVRDGVVYEIDVQNKNVRKVCS